MTNPVWLWAIEQGLSGWSANKAFGGLRSEEAGPCWSFDRYGRTETTLPDGRLVRIGGEYEDWYDADFYIYNDVIVTDSLGATEIFGYSEEAFPPTDFHTADLVGDRIIVIGNLSYSRLRKDKAQVLVLDTTRHSFDRVDATGVGPLWLHKHSSELVEDGRAILVHGGLIDDRRWPGFVENIDDWRLDLETFRWDRLTDRAWPRFAFVRADGAPNHLALLRDLRRVRPSRKSDRWAEHQAERLRDLGAAPRLDLLETLYAPDTPHSKLPDIVGERRAHRISIEDVTVRYVEKDYKVELTVEGALPTQIVEQLRVDLLEKLAAIEKASIDWLNVMVD
jgi:hypothetical protein